MGLFMKPVKKLLRPGWLEKTSVSTVVATVAYVIVPTFVLVVVPCGFTGTVPIVSE
jgi:hypothetical protein